MAILQNSLINHLYHNIHKKEDKLIFVCYFHILQLYKQIMNQTKQLLPLLLTLYIRRSLIMQLEAYAISAPLCCQQQYASSTPLTEWLLKHWCVFINMLLLFGVSYAVFISMHCLVCNKQWNRLSPLEGLVGLTSAQGYRDGNSCSSPVSADSTTFFAIIVSLKQIPAKPGTDLQTAS